MKTRQQRAQRVIERGVLSHITQLTAKEFLQYLLDYYQQYGSTEIVQSKLSGLIDLYGHGRMNIVDLTNVFGGADELMKAWKEVQEELFRI